MIPFRFNGVLITDDIPTLNNSYNYLFFNLKWQLGAESELEEYFCYCFHVLNKTVHKMNLIKEINCKKQSPLGTYFH